MHSSDDAADARPAGRVDALPGERMSAGAAVGLMLACIPLFLSLDHTFWGSETRWSFIARGMFESGDWLEPRLHGSFYGDKPLLSYWTILLAALPLGRVDEVAARLPSVLSGLGTVLLTGWMAARLLGRRWALPAGVALATAYGFVMWMRAASADPLNLLFITAAIAVYLEWRVRPAAWQIPSFFVLMAVGAHAKGTPAFLIPLAVAGSDVLLGRRWTLLREAPRALVWMVVAAALYLAPFVISYLARGDWDLLDLMWKENFVRALDAFDHTQPPWYYLAILPALFVPFSLWLPGGLAIAARRALDHGGTRFALLAFVVVVAVFSASESRRSYYILPALPFAALVVAASWDTALRALERGAKHAFWWRVSLLAPAVLLGLLLAALGLALLLGGRLNANVGPIADALPGAFATGCFCLAAAAGLAWLVIRGRFPEALVLCLAAAVGIAFVLTTSVQSLRESLRRERFVAAEIHARFPDQRVVFYHSAQGPVRWYVGGEDVAARARDLRAHLPEPGAQVLVVCGSGRCKEGALDPSLACEMVVDGSTPALGEWVEAGVQYRAYLCTRLPEP